MKNIELARDYLYRALRCLKEAQLALEERDSAGTIRRAQEALELAVKALLRAHDVSDVLIEHKEALPSPLRERVNHLAELVSKLASLRGPAFYGYEREGIPPSQIFTMEYSRNILRMVEEYVFLIKKLLEGIL